MPTDRIFFHLKELQEKAENAQKEEKKKPGLFQSLCGIFLCFGTFTFTFAVVGLYMTCMLPNQKGKVCYFEQYRTIL
jgi:hypothetical protein